MESITGRRPLLYALRRGRGRADRVGLAIGLAMLGALVAIDASSGSSAAIVGGFVLAPFIPAALGSVFATAIIAVLTVAAGFVSGTWDMNFGQAGYWIRGGEVLIGATFAIVAAAARERARLNSRRLAVLDSVGDLADGSLPLAETLDRVTGAIVPIAADICLIDAIHEGRISRAAVAVAGRPDADEVAERLRRRRPSVPSRFVAGERAWMGIAHFRRRMDGEDLRRMAQGPEDLKFLEELRPRSMITAAMTARGRSLGTVTLVTAWSKRRYTDDDVRFAQVLAKRMGLALDNAGLFSDLESVKRRLDAVMSMLDEAVAVHGATGEIVFANATAARWLGFPNPEAMLDTEPTELLGRFRLWTEGGMPLSTEAIIARVREGPLPDRELLRVTLSSLDEERWMVVSSEPIRGPDGRLLYAVTTADDVSELKRSEFAEQLLARTGGALASSTDYRQILRTVPQISVPGFADWCSVNVHGHEGMIEQVAIGHSNPEKLAVANELRDRYPARIDDRSLVAEVIRAGEPLLIPEITDEQLERGTRDAEHLRLLRRIDLGSAVAVPMTAGAKTVGAIVFANDRGSRAFDRGDLAVAVEMARRVGLAAENARLTGEQVEVARVLQRGLLPPKLPELEGFDAATMYRPAGEVNEVGGDFYDAFEIDGGWMVVMGDVTGRGAAAASLTALARYTIRTAGLLTGNPFMAASIVDESLKRGEELSLCSAVIIVLPASRESPVSASVLAAGHPLPLRVRRGVVEQVGQSGRLLGAPHEPDWMVAPVELAEGDQLILYTDGVTEARGRAERFGEHRLRESVASAPNATAAIASVRSALTSFEVGIPEDDAAVLAIMRTTPPERLPASDGASSRAATASTT